MDQPSAWLSVWRDRLSSLGRGGFLAALLLTAIVLRLGGGETVVRIGIGVLWSGTILFLRRPEVHDLLHSRPNS